MANVELLLIPENVFAIVVVDSAFIDWVHALVHDVVVLLCR